MSLARLLNVASGCKEMTFRKGESGNPAGKAPGTRSRLSVDLREMILGALKDAGGRKYLKRQAKENPGPFLALVGRILPKETHTPPAREEERTRYQLSLDELRAIAATALPADHPARQRLPLLIEATATHVRKSSNGNGKRRVARHGLQESTSQRPDPQVEEADSSTSIQPDSSAGSEPA